MLLAGNSLASSVVTLLDWETSKRWMLDHLGYRDAMWKHSFDSIGADSCYRWYLNFVALSP